MMDSSDLSIDSNLMEVVRNNLMQLHCENVSWERASDKIPLELVRYLLGDLVQYLSTLVFFRGNRCLFLLEWPQMTDPDEAWNYMLADSIGKKTYMEVGHYKVTYMLSHVGPKYEDLVEIYCHAHWHQPDHRFRLEDVWRSGKLLPLEHPEILYLPPSLPGFTPKKPNIIPSQTRGENPDLEDMNHQELVDLVKELLQERANRPPPTNPSKDIPLAGHVTMNQESFAQSSQAILQDLAMGGYIHAKTPKFESFLGDDKNNKLDFDMQERQILPAATTHPSAAIKQAMIQSLKGQALAVTTALPPDTTWEKLLQALEIRYQEKAPYDVLMAQFYGTKRESDEKCASFGTRLEQKLNQVSLQYPNKISETMYWNCVRERFFHGLSKNMKTNLRPQFD